MFSFFDTTIGKILIAPLGYLVGKAIEVIIEIGKDFSFQYIQFANTFSSFIQQLESGNETLNVLIVNEFPKHDLARIDFIRFLGKRRRKIFNKKWASYVEKYNQVKQLGPMGMIVVFETSDRDRKKELIQLIQELLKIAKKKCYWFY